jgi:sugar lactone lactonase YvrE
VRIGARTALAALVAVGLTTTGPMALAQASGDGGGGGGHGHHARTTLVFTLPATATNPEGVAFDKRTDAFFTGEVANGTIWRGTLDSPTLEAFITPPAGANAVGMKVKSGLLYVAGGPSGKITVYDIATKAVVASFDTGAGGFLNDLVVGRHGDVWVTDSFRSKIWHVTGDQVEAGTGVPDAIDLSASIPPAAGVFALNGIVSLHHGRQLLAVQSNTGTLWSLDADVADPDAEAVTVEPTATSTAPLTGGDGMIVDKGRLLVVIGNSASIAVVKLRHHQSEAQVRNLVTDPTLVGPSTIARAENVYLVVNANFGGAAPFTLSGLDRRALKHGGHGGGHH